MKRECEGLRDMVGKRLEEEYVRIDKHEEILNEELRKAQERMGEQVRRVREKMEQEVYEKLEEK